MSFFHRDKPKPLTEEERNALWLDIEKLNPGIFGHSQIPRTEVQPVKPQPVQPTQATTPKPEIKRTGQTKDTNTIRFHNDFIAKLKDLKGPDRTFEEYLKDRLGV